MPNFREDYISDWKMKVLDVVGHTLLGTMIWYLFRHYYPPWVIVLQWLPDIFLYPRWLYGIWTGKYLPASNWFVQLHRHTHGIHGLGIAVFAFFFISMMLGLNMITHWLWDQVTHRSLKKHPRAEEIL